MLHYIKPWIELFKISDCCQEHHVATSTNQWSSDCFVNAQWIIFAVSGRWSMVWLGCLRDLLGYLRKWLFHRNQNMYSTNKWWVRLHWWFLTSIYNSMYWTRCESFSWPLIKKYCLLFHIMPKPSIATPFSNVKPDKHQIDSHYFMKDVSK